MSDNLRHWSALEKTDPTATKSFKRAGGFSGTATKPIYHEKRMTEHFGPCGLGWGMDKPEFQMVTAENEILVFCTVALWYRDGESTGTVYGVGGDKVIAQQRSGPFVSDEAFKAAFTDALGNAMKHVGVGADVHMGEFDKYGRDRDEPPARAAAPARAMEADPFSSPAPTRAAPQATRAAALPVNPEEPPEVGLARAELKRLIREIRSAVTEEQITDPKRGIRARNPETIAKISKYGGQAAIDKLDEEERDQLAMLRTELPV